MPGETVLRPFLKGVLLFLRWEGSHSAILKPWGTWKACSFFPGLRVNASFWDSKPRLLPMRRVRKTLLIIFFMRHQQKSLLQISQSDWLATKGSQVLLGKGGRGQVWKEQQREEGGWEMSSAPNPQEHSGHTQVPIKSEYCCIPPWSSPGFPSGSVVKNLPANAQDGRDAVLNSGLGRSPGGEHGNPLQYSCLGNPLYRGAWWATVHEESDATEHTHTMVFSLPDLLLKCLFHTHYGGRHKDLTGLSPLSYFPFTSLASLDIQLKSS